MHTVKYANNTLEYANTEKLHLPIFVNTSYERVKFKVLDNVVQDHKVHMPLYFAMKIRSSFIVSIKLKEQMEAKNAYFLNTVYTPKHHRSDQNRTRISRSSLSLSHSHADTKLRNFPRILIGPLIE